MTNLVKGSIIALGTSSTVAIPLSLHLTNQPSTFGEKLTWDGKSHLSQDDKDDHWKAKFNDYSTEVTGIKVTGYSEGEVSDEHLKKLKQWCVDEAKKELSGNQGYETYSSLCSTALKTLKGRMISEAIKLASQDSDWKLIFINNKHIESFTKELASGGDTIDSKTSIDNGYQKVKEICEKWFKEPPHSPNYQKVKVRCVEQTIRTVKEKLQKQKNFQLMSSDDDYTKVASRWSQDSNYKVTVGGQGDCQALKTYCEDKMTKNLFDLNNYDDDIQKIRSYCDGHIPQR